MKENFFPIDFAKRCQSLDTTNTNVHWESIPKSVYSVYKTFQQNSGH